MFRLNVNHLELPLGMKCTVQRCLALPCLSHWLTVSDSHHYSMPLITSLLPLFSPGSGVSADLCRVTGGVLGIHWSSVISLGWHPLADGRGGATCWESCCLKPSCGAVWSLGGRCVLLGCSRTRGCPITSLPQPHQESLGLLQLLSKVCLLLADLW